MTPFLFVSRNLCDLSSFLNLMTVTQPSTDGYMRQIHTQNTVASWLIRFAYWFIICFKRNFNASFIRTLDNYVARVIYIQGEVSDQILGLLGGFRVPAIVVCELAAVVQQAIRFGLDAHLDDRYTRACLGEYIGSRFTIPTTELMAKGYKDEEILPSLIVQQRPSEFSFSESRLQPIPLRHLGVTAPNEVLANSMRRRIPGRGHLIRVEPNRRVEVLLDSTELIMAQKHADYLVARKEDRDPVDGIEASLQASVDRYFTSRAPADYDSLVANARHRLDRYPTAQDLVLCCPAINRQITWKLLSRTVPDRILKYVFKQRAADYMNWFSRADIRSEGEFRMVAALTEMQRLEANYVNDCLTLYALALRRPILRTPQLSGGLFGRLKNLRLTHAQGSLSTFAKQTS